MPLLACLVLVAACTESPEKAQARMQAEADAARPEIEAQHARFSRGAAAGNADTMLAAYAPDATLMPPNLPAMGLDSTRARFAAVGPYQVSFATRSLEVNGALAVERGVWSATLSPPGFTFAVVRDGKYLAHWRRINGQWLMVEHIWNDDYHTLM
jgi:ketosteroid isomerase-like protein